MTEYDNKNKWLGNCKIAAHYWLPGGTTGLFGHFTRCYGEVDRRSDRSRASLAVARLI